MKIITLVENTSGSRNCRTEHGLCLYIETGKHHLLMDTGASDLLLENAAACGVDLTKVDTVILSHGHYDHGGGIPAFAKLNPHAKIYMHEDAAGPYYSSIGGRYLGLPEGAAELPQVVRVKGFLKIDEELSLFSDIPTAEPLPASNADLMRKEGDTLVPDDFRHEQCLVIRQGGQQILLSGCAHHGILNIMRHYRTLFGKDPDYVFSGFHLRRKDGHYSEEDIRTIVHTAAELKKCRTQFYTGHCTGEKPYEAMKGIMGDKLHYIHCGDTVIIPKKGGKKGMKWHKFFAWATVFCFCMTMITGYEHK